MAKLLGCPKGTKVMKRRSRPVSSVLLLACVLAFFPFPSPAATAAAAPPGLGSKPAAAEAERQDPLGRGTPHGTVTGFIWAKERGDVSLATSYLEGTQPAGEKEELARDLKAVLDRGLAIRLEDLSRAPEGQPNDGLAPDLEKVGTATYGGRSFDIVLRRTTSPGPLPIWLFSSETLDSVRAASKEIELPWAEALWPESFRQVRVLSFPLFRLVNQLVAVPLAFGAAWFLTLGLLSVLRPLLRRWSKEHGEDALTRAKRPLLVLSISLVLRIAAPLSTAVGIRIFFTTLATVGMVGAATWLLVRTTRYVTDLKVGRLRRARSPGAIAMLELLGWALIGFWVVAGLLLVMRSLGLDFTTALAGLGIGGVAVAFAAQKTIENLFGTVTIVTEGAIQVGDRCRIGEFDGWVEDIGLRSTRVRTQDRILVSIPNGQVATMSIQNLQKREKRLFRHAVHLRHETTADQLRSVLTGLRAMLGEHPKVERPPHRQWVRFIRLGDSSLELEVYVYVLVRSAEAFREIQEELLLGILKVVEASGARLALPSHTAYLARDAVGTHEGQTRRASGP